MPSPFQVALTSLEKFFEMLNHPNVLGWEATFGTLPPSDSKASLSAADG